MKFPDNFTARSVFHSRYFQLVSQDKRFAYTKRNPRHVVDQAYLNELIVRRNESGHLPTFGVFLELCTEIERRCRQQ